MTTSNSSNARPRGLTRDVGWEIGVSRTVAVPLAVAWSFLTSERGAAIWLGDGVRLPAAAGQTYRTAEGIAGEFRSYHEHDRIRLTWQPSDWDHDATLQLAMGGDDAKTMIRFHQERLASSEERERMRGHWRAVLDAIVAELAPAT